MALAARLLGERDPLEVIAALAGRSTLAGPCEPHVIQAVVERAHTHESRPPREHGAKPRRDGAPTPRGAGDEFTTFHVSWGAKTGASTSRLLAMVCRRGDVRSTSIGAIRVGPHQSMVDVATSVAAAFARAAEQPDPRNPRVRIQRWNHDAAPRKGHGTPSANTDHKRAPRSPGLRGRGASS
jgi:ATP-dependent RNA helicase DeaD